MYRRLSSESFPSISERRSRIRLCLDVLKVIDKGVEKPTNIMYKSNLSWSTFKKILSLLESEGLIRCETIGERKRYKITKKGTDALNYYRKAEEILISKP
jgi:predicted transcriptional regulator